MVHAADDNLDAGLGLERIRKRQHLDEVLVRNGKRKAGVCTVVRGHRDHIDVDIELRDALEYLSHKACGGGAALQGDQCDIADRADFGCAHDLFHPFLNHSGHVVKAGAFAAHEYRCVYCAHREQLFGLRGMGERDDLVVARKDHLMLADNGAAAHGGMPISLFSRFLRCAWRSYIYCVSPSRTEASASASIKAVPLGASIFWLWCFSTISMSNWSPSTFAAFFCKLQHQVNAE